MNLLCARLGCGQSAAASLQFDSKGSRVIIVDLVEPTAGIPICGDHLATRTPPMGWTLSDERIETVDSLVLVQDVDVPEERPAVRRPGTRAFEWIGDDAEPESLEPTSPLLARAFRGS